MKTVPPRQPTARKGSQAPKLRQETPSTSRRVKTGTGVRSGAVARSGASPFDALTEKQFQRHVVEGLKERGWLVWTVPDMTRTARGLPDIIAVHPTQVPRRVLFWELKSVRGRVRPEQKVALAALGEVYGVDARVLRPADWARESEVM